MKTSIIIAGDYCPQKRVATLITEGQFETLYSGVKRIVSESDYSLVNFECPVATDETAPIVKCGPSLKCDTKGVEALSYCGFKAVTLANNHFRDYGNKGVLSTLDELDKRGIDHVGGGRNINEASTILYKNLKGRTYAFVNCCEHEFSIATDSRPGSNPLNIINQYRTINEAKGQADYVIVIVHGGAEGCQYPSPRMQKTYHFFIEVGADAVINHHQHCYSGYEYYLGKPICYGLGNFSFDSIFPVHEMDSSLHSSWNEGYMVRLSFDDSLIEIEALPYIQAFKEPGTIMLDGNELSEFERRLQLLNDCIKDPSMAEAMYNKWVDSNSDWHRIIFEPWGKGWRILRKKGWLPSLVSKQKWLSLADYIMCESHHDRIKRIFDLMIDRYNS